MNNENEKMIKFSVSTMDDIRGNAADIIEWYEKCIEWFSTNDRKPQYIPIIYNDGKIKIKNFNNKNWEDVKKSLYKGEIEDFLLPFYTDYQFSVQNPIPDAIIHTTFSKKQANRQNIKKTISELFVAMRPNIFNVTKQGFISLFKEVYINLNGSCGYLDYLMAEGSYSGLQKSPLESVRSTEIFELNKYLRSYSWANILSEQHIEILGGEKYVKENVPHYIFEELAVNNKKAYYIQLTEDIFDFKPEQYLKLKEFLKPVLPEENLKETVLYDYDGKRRELNRLVYSKEDSLILNEAQKIPFNELDKIVFAHIIADKKDSDKNNDKKEYEYIKYSVQKDAEPSCLDINVQFGDINEKQYESCKAVIESWANIGLYGGYGSNIHSLFGIFKEDNSVLIQLDMGNSDLQLGLDIFERVINQFAKLNELEIKKITIGNNSDI